MLEILQYRELPRQILEGMQIVHQEVFEGALFKEEKLADKQDLLIFISLIEDRVVGFKMGYKIEEGVFYSWLGGVHPAFQKQGIAQALMTAQHNEIKKQGYQRVRTYSRNHRKGMLILNLKNGFDVIDTFIDNKGRHKIRLEKML